MKLIEEISSLFGVSVDNILMEESLFHAKISLHIHCQFNLTGEKLISLKELIYDDYQIDFLYCQSSEITLNKNYTLSYADEFVSKIINRVEDLDWSDPDDKQVLNSLTIQIAIRKIIKKQILHIYNFASLCLFWEKLCWRDRLNALSKNDLKNGAVFYLLEDDIKPFKTEAFYFTNDITLKPQITDYMEDIRENVYWSNIDIYPLSPIYFHLIQRGDISNIFTKTFDVLSTIISLCTLFDITSICEDDCLKYKLCGYKNVSGKMDIEIYSIELAKTELEYYKLFKWVYVGEGNKSDKIGIVRNILSLFITNNSIGIQENVFLSVQSSFKTYLKDNLDKYVAIRNQVYQELDSIIALSSATKKDFLDGFKNNLLACVTFFFSTLVLEVLGKNQQSTNLFSSDVAILCNAIFLISFLYMLWMRGDIDHEKKNISKRYSILKERYSDLLIPKEVDIILRNGKELNEQIDYINLIKRKYTILWICSLLILVIIVIILSNYQCG